MTTTRFQQSDYQSNVNQTDGYLHTTGIQKKTTATIPSGITPSTTVSTKLLNANTNRLFVEISNASSSIAVFIKLQAASVDNLKKGIRLRGGNRIRFTAPFIYTGEISAIAESGTPVLHLTEY